MARGKQLDASDIDVGTMERARKNAREKAARLMAEAELGLREDGAPVIKGPAPMKDEEMVTLTLDLAPHSLELRIDNTIYRNGQTITVGARVAASIREMIALGWRHQEEIDGKPHNFYKPRMPVLSGKAA